ncbi:DUF6401 family natural product biosynthesis protein [Amycolatopsis palatopharyngis]|uniref:DUF6401 family natural product biosynthesis protein n=1 Tax=Amycolatopsis palatopharyngis TaxID=187982 RepID=UPI001FE7C1B4|nr:DUF6401 family natural product biosynthesis protein [Amycolatopsis palatopharyngis]
MSSLTDIWVESAARRTLARLNEQIGSAGLTAVAATPWLAAAVDQHSAAVRDIIEFGVEGSAAMAGVVLLAGYARGLLDRARETGWTVPVPVEGKPWAHTDWMTTRLLGVCALARTIDEPQPRLDDIDPTEPAFGNG